MALSCILAMASLQGCLFARVAETRTQLCEEQPPRVLVVQEPGRPLRVVFEKPTLTEQDVIAIVGLDPTTVDGTQPVRELSYEARPVDRLLDRSSGLALRLFFVRHRGEYRLSAVEIPERLSAVLPPPLLAAAVKIGCSAQIVVVPPRSTFDLATLDKATLPTPEALKQLLGPPIAALPPPKNEFAYRYCLMPCDASSTIIASLSFDFGSGGELQRAEASYFRYWARVDLTSAKPTAVVELR